MSEKLITIATFNQPIEANIAKTRLASEDIECFLLDENATALGGELNYIATGGIKLQVRESDAETASAILQNAD